MVKLILIGAFSLSLLIRVFLILNGKHVADIWHIARMGEIFLSGKNPYLVLDFNVYPPLSVFLSALTQIMDNVTKIPFYMLVKIWPNAADFASAYLIYKILKKQNVKPILRSFWTGLFILNPVSIIISAAHGQLDSISAFLVILAIYHLKTAPKISALALGLSITVKPHPLILLPLFLIAVSTKYRFRYLLITAAPVVLGLLPFLASEPVQIIKGLLTYSGITDFGYAALLRGIWFQDNANPNLPINLINELLKISKVVLIFGIIGLTFLFRKSQNIAKSALVIYLLFISVYFGIGAQYLSWIIPFAIIVKDKTIIIYTFAATIALVGFYLYFGPDLLLGKLTGSMLPFSNKYMYYYFYGNLLLWVTCLVWFFYLLIKTAKSVSPIRSDGRKDISFE